MSQYDNDYMNGPSLRFPSDERKKPRFISSGMYSARDGDRYRKPNGELMTNEESQRMEVEERKKYLNK